MVHRTCNHTGHAGYLLTIPFYWPSVQIPGYSKITFLSFTLSASLLARNSISEITVQVLKGFYGREDYLEIGLLRMSFS